MEDQKDSENHLPVKITPAWCGHGLPGRTCFWVSAANLKEWRQIRRENQGGQEWRQEELGWVCTKRWSPQGKRSPDFDCCSSAGNIEMRRDESFVFVIFCLPACLLLAYALVLGFEPRTSHVLTGALPLRCVLRWLHPFWRLPWLRGFWDSLSCSMNLPFLHKYWGFYRDFFDCVYDFEYLHHPVNFAFSFLFLNQRCS